MNRLLTHIVSSVWAITQDAAEMNLQLLFNALNGSQLVQDPKEVFQKAVNVQFGMKGIAYQISEYGEAVKPENAPPNSVAIISLDDVIYKYDMSCGPAGMITKANILKRCDASDNIIGVVLKIDSPGGEGTAAMLMNETIRGMNKPVVAFVDDLCASAGYYIASACDHVIANDTMARVGSIGTYVTIADFTERFKQQGVKIIEVYADQSKDKNKPYYEAIKGNLKPMKEMVNKFNDRFLADVAENRSGGLKNDSWNTGKLFFADEALKIGLIDGIDSLDNVIQNFYK